MTAMDFFDAKKQKLHAVRLAIGYVIIGLVLLLATTVMLHWAYGYGLDKKGRVIQNGLVFVSSRPEGAAIYINGRKYKDNTNARMNLPAGQYVIELKRNGYHDWKRVVTVEGGSLGRFDYPFLFPVKPETTITKQYAAAISLSSTSPDRRWLLVSAPEQNAVDLFDLESNQPEARSLTISTDILAAGSTTMGWQEVEWAKDNRHVLLKRFYDISDQRGSEYILLDREQPGLSRNLSVAFGFSPSRVELRGQAYDGYYLFDQASGQLFTASLERPTPQPFISDVIAFSTDGDTVAYVTAVGAPDGKVLVRVQEKDAQPYTVKQMPAGSAYLLDMAAYEKSLYLAAGAAVENRVFLYRDPVVRLEANPDEPLAPIQILKVAAPSHVSFSLNKRFVIAESGDKFSVYDAETDRGYAYQTGLALDKPQGSAKWMDGYRLCYISDGKVVVFDFDGTNLQSLSPGSPSHSPVFDRKYRFVYTLNAQNALTSTALLTKDDL